MISLIVVWYLQDFTQALLLGVLLVPDFFLLAAAYGIISRPLTQESVSVWIWLAFIGGVLWDFRWAYAPGISGLVNALTVLSIYTVWIRTPVDGRSVWLFGFLAGMAHLVSGFVHNIAWVTMTQPAARMFLVQQLLGIPALILACGAYAFGMKDSHV